MQTGCGRVGDVYSGYEPVHWAANYDDTAALSTCVAEDASCATRATRRGMTPLHICALNNSVQCARALLELLSGTAHINAVNCWGETPLHIAGSCDARSVRSALLEAGADALVCDVWGRAACSTADESSLELQPPQLSPACLPVGASGFNEELKSAIISPKLRVAPRPVVRGIFSDSQPASASPASASPASASPASASPASASPLASAAPSARSLRRRPLSGLVEFPGDRDGVCLLLRDTAVDAAGADSFGLTALHKFASWNNCSLLQLLLVYAAPPLTAAAVNARCPGNMWTALHFCVDMRAHDALAVLVQDPRVDAMSVDSSGKTAWDLARDNGDDIALQLLQAAL